MTPLVWVISSASQQISYGLTPNTNLKLIDKEQKYASSGIVDGMFMTKS
jgi:hypothetical protein